ncbi:MAG: type II secretion system F family protein [Dongiaceae bacterium]
MLAILVFAGTMLFLPIIFRTLPPATVFALAAFGTAIGYVAPAWRVDYRRAKRQRLIREGFPDSLDLLLICVEAGLGLDAAISKVSSELSLAHPILAEHYRFVGAELRAGRSRHEALRGFSDRTGVDEVRSLVTLLIQSDELGTSIAQALRVHAFEMRAQRLLRAEEKAHKIPVKLAFPLMFGLIPVVFMVTLTPAIIKFVTFIGPILSKGMPSPG